MMKVYYVVPEPSERMFNHFVPSLGNALQQQGCEVVYGLERLWTDEVYDCDIVHFQWPEYIWGPQKRVFSDNDITRLSQRLVQLKEFTRQLVNSSTRQLVNFKCVRLFVQVHNLKPHAKNDNHVLQLYELLYQYADVIVHMGNYSRDLLQPEYPHARHVVIPHHIYDNIYSFNIAQEEARLRLHLPADKRIVLSFGKFRNEQERNFVLNLKNKCTKPSAPQPPKGGVAAQPIAPPLGGRGASLFLMPGFYRETLHTWNPKKLVTRLYHTLRYKLKGIRFCNEVIPDDLMQCYFCAADVVLIQRLDILNSGNLPMAFHAGKVVVGPNVGNVGQILRETGNFTFDPHDMSSAVDALQKALAETTKGKENKAYATEHWSSKHVAATLLEIYKHAPTP